MCYVQGRDVFILVKSSHATGLQFAIASCQTRIVETA